MPMELLEAMLCNGHMTAFFLEVTDAEFARKVLEITVGFKWDEAQFWFQGGKSL